MLVPWLHPWPAPGVYAHFLANAVLALLVAAGWRTRLSASLLCVGLTALFLMERGVYINHAYLYCLYAGLLAFVPAGYAFSLDVAHGRRTPSATAPSWSLWALRFQIAVVYVFAGFAKLDGDWLRAAPMSIWLGSRAETHVLGPLLAAPVSAFFFSWGGLAFDLLVVPGMLWARTRRVTFAVAVSFHLLNAVVFGIGTFPWFSILATALFFPPAAFRRLPVLRTRLPARPAPAPIAAARMSRPALAALSVYAAVQLLLPLRPLAHPGRAAWTEEGATFAWRMMLRDKRGGATFIVRDPVSGAVRRETPARYTTQWQRRTLIGTPDLLLQFAHWLADGAERRGLPRPQVRAITRVSLNGRPHAPIVDPRVDLAREPRSLAGYPWVLPLPDGVRRDARRPSR